MAQYVFPDAINNNTFDGTNFQISKNGSPLQLTSGSIEMVMLCGGIYQSFSTMNGKLTITDATSGSFQFNKQLISLPSVGTFNYFMRFRLNNGDVKDFITGSWTILTS